MTSAPAPIPAASVVRVSAAAFGLAPQKAGAVVITKDTAAADPDDQFQIVPGTGSVLDVAQLRVTYDDTKDLPPGVYKFDVQVEDATGRRFRVAVGTVSFQAALSVFTP